MCHWAQIDDSFDVCVCKLCKVTAHNGCNSLCSSSAHVEYHAAAATTDAQCGIVHVKGQVQ
jgi:hypothetical protein